MNLIRFVAIAAVCGLISSTSFAQETAGECTQCPSSKATSLTENAEQEECTQCPVMTAALEKLPKMTYKVGEETTCCSTSAEAMAKENSQAIHFVVAEKTYEDKAAAYTALVSQTEEFVTEFVTPHKCETSGKTTLAGETCDCPVSSAKYAEQVKTAVDAVTMSYKVGEESCDCPTKAATMAKETEGAEVEYVVGEECTSCELTARMNLAHAKYKAAVAAINQATSTKENEGS